MKKIITLLLAGGLCLTLAGCNLIQQPPKGETPGVAVTEDTDPVSLASEKVDRSGWKGAFTDADNYGVKSVITVEETENGHTMSEVVTLSYRFDGDLAKLFLTLAEGGKTSYIAESYLEFGKDAVTVWQRAKENDGWTEWDSETFTAEALSSAFGLSDGLSFIKDKYADFSYSDADKGYTATTSGLAALREGIGTFVEGLFMQAGEDTSQLDVSRFVVKVNGGKPSACIAELRTSRPAPDARDVLPEEGGQEPEEGGQSPEAPEVPETPETPAGGMDTRITLTQVYFDYGTTKVEKPSDINGDGSDETDKPGQPASPGKKEGQDAAIEIVPL